MEREPRLTKYIELDIQYFEGQENVPHEIVSSLTTLASQLDSERKYIEGVKNNGNK